MSRSNLYKFLFLIVVILEFVCYGSCCSDTQWSCHSGQCINLDKLCDGRKDCRDSSDEIADECFAQKCPWFAFRCAYGACVSGDVTCDKTKDCVDGSDELENLCGKKNYVDLEIREKPSIDLFECDNGNYISLDRPCDGVIDCLDESDELIEHCSSYKCPNYAFQCGYGACIEISKRCDGKIDCILDGSDESSKLCGYSQKKIIPRISPTTSPSSIKSQGCQVPNRPNSKFVKRRHDTQIQPGETLMHGAGMLHYCLPGYDLVGSQTNTCNNSIWIEIHGNCIKHCPNDMIHGITFNAACSLDKQTVSCESPIRAGTIANITCQERYKIPDGEFKETLVCQEDGTWDNNAYPCEQFCGEELLQLTPFSVKRESNISRVPWHAGIINRKQKNETICGGNIVSANVVITAAHCFWNGEQQKMMSKSDYFVGAGKSLREFSANEDLQQFSDIINIFIPPNFKHADNLHNDIAVLELKNSFQFNNNIGPVCIEWKEDAEKAIASQVYGITAGWGEDNSRSLSKTLGVAAVTSTSYDDCTDSYGEQYKRTITNEKFCVLNSNNGAIVCHGDSGGGFVEKRKVKGKYVNYLWGVVSGGVPTDTSCSQHSFILYTNIQYFEKEIKNFMNKFYK